MLYLIFGMQYKIFKVMESLDLFKLNVFTKNLRKKYISDSSLDKLLAAPTDI